MEVGVTSAGASALAFVHFQASAWMKSGSAARACGCSRQSPAWCSDTTPCACALHFHTNSMMAIAQRWSHGACACACACACAGKNIEGWKLRDIKRDAYPPTSQGVKLWQADRKRWLAERCGRMCACGRDRRRARQEEDTTGGGGGRAGWGALVCEGAVVGGGRRARWGMGVWRSNSGAGKKEQAEQHEKWWQAGEGRGEGRTGRRKGPRASKEGHRRGRDHSTKAQARLSDRVTLPSNLPAATKSGNPQGSCTQKACHPGTQSKEDWGVGQEPRPSEAESGVPEKVHPKGMPPRHTRQARYGGKSLTRRAGAVITGLWSPLRALGRGRH
eukprot:356116-Chlamydomonas_euryale.AAC.2